MTDENSTQPIPDETDKKKSPAGIFLKCFGVLLIFSVCLLTLTTLFRDKIVKKIVCDVGSKLTGSEVYLQDFSSTLSGLIQIKGLSVGNPQGYSAGKALVLEDVSVDINVSSLFSSQKIINSISIRGMQVNFESKFNENNFRKILNNIQNTVSASSGKKDSAEQRTVEKNEEKKAQDTGILILDFDSKNAQVSYTNTVITQPIHLPLPPLHLSDIGGASMQDITLQLFSQLLSVVSRTVVNAGKGIKGILSNAEKQINKTIRSTGNEFSLQTRELGTKLRQTGNDLVNSFKNNINNLKGK